MATRSKRYRDQAEQLDPTREHSVPEAVSLLMEQATANFNETLECHIRLNIDPTHADEQIRDSLVLPNGTGKETRVLVFAKGEKVQEAQEAGADYVGGEDLIEKIQEGWLEFDQAVATPDMMSEVSVLGPVLGPRKMMPNNKSGTVTFELENAIEKLKKGQQEIRNDKYGIVHTIVGTADMPRQDVEENLKAILKFLIENRPSGVKGRGRYIRSITLSPSMGPSVKVKPSAAWELAT